MQLLDRIKQNVDLDANGDFVFGAAVDGYQALTLEDNGYDGFTYLLTNSGGSLFEFGRYVRDPASSNSRLVEMSNVVPGNPSTGFADSTTGLILSIVVSTSNIFASTGQTPPRSAGQHSMAAGEVAQARHKSGVAIGKNTYTTIEGEAIVGTCEGAWRSTVPVSGYVESEGSGILYANDGAFGSSAASFQISNNLMAGDRDDTTFAGVIILKGHVCVTVDGTVDDQAIQVYEVSGVFRGYGGNMQPIGSVTFTSLVPDSTITDFTIGYDQFSAQFEIENASLDETFIVDGLFVLTRLGSTDIGV